jgi:poly-gamma-glutamate capsule biosynthesis protein CapA/YwtB (metallophosphatase superfamily)
MSGVDQRVRVVRIVAGMILVLILVRPVDARGAGPHAWLADSAVRGDTTGPTAVRMLCLGDVNLGRHVGQVLLQGDTAFPWYYLRDSLSGYDIVFANLESNLSDQHGKTEDPRSNTIFTGPPVGANSLREGGVTLVSTANNHALDFGVDAQRQTCALLDAAGIAHAGSADDSVSVYTPALLRVHGFRVALFACTELMNGARDRSWGRVVATADSGALFPLIRRIRDSVDVIVVSIHGGVEYASAPAPGLLRFAEGAVDAGADVVLGHHPHVPYAVFKWHGGIIAPSLGNCVFKQPFHYWTQRSFALSLLFERSEGGQVKTSFRCEPLRADYQPRFLPPGADYDAVMKRVSPNPSNE